MNKVGKIRRKAFRQHYTVPSVLEPSILAFREGLREIEDLPKPYYGLQENVSFSPITSSIFKNIHIKPETLRQKLPTYSKKDEKNLEVKSAIAENSLTNSIRGRRRKIPFHEVIASAKDFLKKREEAKKKKPNVLNDLKALQAALPTVEEKGQKKDDKVRTSKPFTKQNAEMMEDLQAYQQCLARPDFQADPFSAVTSILTQHILKS